MIRRLLTDTLLQSLAEVPAVCLLGPRQVGKTTLALAASSKLNPIYLDLESEQDRARLAEPELWGITGTQWRIQGRSATKRAAASEGVLKPRHFIGRVLMVSSTRSISTLVSLAKSVPFGK